MKLSSSENERFSFYGNMNSNNQAKGRKYTNFTDLGNYIIDCGRHQNFDFELALEYTNQHLDIEKNFGCSALATRTKSGDVVIGRNLDLTVSQYPCYITHLKFAKYETLNFTYDEVSSEKLTYTELLRRGEIEAKYYNALPMMASDSMNSQGLYMEYNMRGYEEQFICRGTNPYAPIRACTVSLPFLVTSHCASIEEALYFMRNKLNLYTLIDETIASGWNLCCMIGDATGAYGLIEIANDEIKFLPEQHGQGNYYIYPEFNSTSREQSGYGRLQFGLERIDTIQNDAQMASIMEDIMWRNEILTIPYAYRDSLGHIHFCADPKHRTKSLDWRSDNVKKLPVNKQGMYVDIDADTKEAMLVRDYKKGYENYLAGIDTKKNIVGYVKYTEYLERCNLTWVQNNDNFEALQQGLIRYYTENGTFDKLKRYYAGDEKPLRDDGNIFTTSLSFSVNCTKRRLRVKFWENPNCILYYQW